MTKTDIKQSLTQSLEDGLGSLLQISEQDYDEASAERVPESASVLAPWKWHLGHLLLYMKMLREALREGLGRDYQDDFPTLEEKFGYGTEYSEEADYPPLSELVAGHREVLEQIKSLVEEYELEDLLAHFERQEVEFEVDGEVKRQERWMKSPFEALHHHQSHLSYHFGQMRLLAKAQDKWSWRPGQEEQAGTA